MSPADKCKAAWIHPAVIGGGVVPVVNIAGVKTRSIKTIGRRPCWHLYGKITTWNDARIQALNPSLNHQAAVKSHG